MSSTWKFGRIASPGTHPIERLEPRQLLAVGPLLISEFAAANDSMLIDSFEKTSDWIELHNPTDSPVSVEGWSLTDDADDLQKWYLPNLIVEPGGFVLIFASGLDLKDPTSELHANFALDTEGEYLGLIRPDQIAAHAFAPQFPPQQIDVSYGLPWTDGEIQADASKYFSEPSPGAANKTGLSGFVTAPQFSMSHGFFDAPFDLTITSDTSDAEIRYTTNGQAPTQSTGTVYSSPIRIHHTTVLRAVAFKPDQLPSVVGTQTYLFSDDIVRQDTDSAITAGLSTEWGRVRSAPGDNEADFEMDPEIVNDPAYDVANSLRTLPTLSLVSDGENLFGPTGIYANPGRRGIEWERPTSVELIYPDGSEGFQVDAGLRMQGAYSRTHAKKNGMRLVFKDQYGPTALEFPLFGDGEQNRFNTLVLRAGFNDSWYSNIGPGEAQYTRDEFNLQIQRAMGHETINTEFMHVYLNGTYWGLYNVVERPDAAFAAEHFGGDEDEWDSINHNGVEDGNDEAWNTLLELVKDSSPEGFLRLQGIDPANPAAESYLDVDNFIDYVIGNIYTANTDWPHKNWYAARRRGPESEGFRFFSWDAELSVNLSNWSRLTTNHTRLCGSPNANRCEDLYLIFDPLRNNPEFRLRFADRIHKHFFNDGVLFVDPDRPAWDPEHPERNRPAEMYREVNEQIRDALVAESARWGDAIRSDQQAPYKPDVEWQTELNDQLKEYFPQRNQIVLDQLRSPRPNSDGNADPFYPSVVAPAFDINNQYQHGGQVQPGDLLTMKQQNGGTVYYTTNGTDPRLPSGAISPEAIRTNTVDYINGSSEARYFIPTGHPSESDWRTVDFDDTSWNQGSAALGFDTGQSEDTIQVPNGFTVRQVHSTERLPDWAAVELLFSGENLERETVVENVPLINYLDRDRRGHFDNNIDFPGGGGTNFALEASGRILVRETGDYTIGVSSNDAARLSVDGVEIIFDADRHRTRDSFATINLTAGLHDLEMTMFNQLGTSTVELFFAHGTKDEFDADFVLLGDDQSIPLNGFIQSDIGSDNASASVYIRVPFAVSPDENLNSLALEMRYDDGFVAFLNGVEVASQNAPEIVSHDSQAVTFRSDAKAIAIEQFDLSKHIELLQPGNNLLAIQSLNASAEDPDLLLQPTLVASSSPHQIEINESTIVNARTFEASAWSALNQATYRVSEPAGQANLRISEVHYHPAGSTTQEAAAGFSDADSFEFIELANIGERAIDLSEVAFTKTHDGETEQGVAFRFIDGDITELPPNERMVVVEDVAAFRFRYGDSPAVAGEWSGRLSNASETIRLIAGNQLLQQFRYVDDWQPTTDGMGPSLEIIDASDPNLENWSRAESWQPSRNLGGTPSSTRLPIVGDANHDGIFDSSDLVTVFMAGQYDDAIPTNSSFETGDWNGDGEFDSSDLVFAFQKGNYIRLAVPIHLIHPRDATGIVDSDRSDEARLSNKTLLNPKTETLEAFMTWQFRVASDLLKSKSIF